MLDFDNTAILMEADPKSLQLAKEAGENKEGEE